MRSPAAMRIAAALGGALLLAAAFSLYRNPALDLVLGAVRFCG